ncbi:MAG: RluA family pseudouridine synthase [Pseudomonadota bacterium]
MAGVQTRSVASDEDGMRLDRWFRTHFPALHHGKLEQLLRKGQVRVDGGRAKAALRLVAGQSVRIPPMPDQPADQRQVRTPIIDPEIIARDARAIEEMILHEDETILVLNKPHGLAVQGGSGTPRHVDGMVRAWAMARATDAKDPAPRLVHRLDRDTAGVLILAKTRQAATRLGHAFQTQTVEKTYWALTVGVPSPRFGTIKRPIAKRMVRTNDDTMLEKMVPAEGETAKRAISDFQVLGEAGADIGFVALRPRTGRTHQLRVHCAVIGTPIIGDGKYGFAQSRIEGLSGKLHLHCRSMRFQHPLTGAWVRFTAPLLSHMHKAWRFFDFDEETDAQWPDQ